jgi:hypothetical protein
MVIFHSSAVLRLISISATLPFTYLLKGFLSRATPPMQPEEYYGLIY